MVIRPDIDASVVVCTRNRSDLLAEACRAALAVDYPADRWELVIVDNASTDDTARVAEGLRTDHPDRLRVVSEPTIGLSPARNAGVRAADADVVVFLDDDAFPDRGWLGALVAAFEDDGVDAAGGPVAPEFKGELPGWFRGRYLPYLTVWDLGEEACDLVYNEYPRGANIAYRRRAFERYGEFSRKLGRRAHSLLSCEETELCLRIERGGGRIRYVPQARVRHVTAADRVTPGWLLRRFASQGRSEAIIDWRHAGFSGLRTGMRSAARRVIAGGRERRLAGTLYARCQRRALRGYAVGAIEALTTVSRYRPPDETVELMEWSPIG